MEPSASAPTSPKGKIEIIKLKSSTLPPRNSTKRDSPPRASKRAKNVILSNIIRILTPKNKKPPGNKKSPVSDKMKCDEQEVQAQGDVQTGEINENCDTKKLYSDDNQTNVNMRTDSSHEKSIRQRPHSLNIKTKIMITGAGGYKVCHSSKMVSVDSIGTCSLNLEDESSLSSALIGGIGSSASQLAVQSASIEPVTSPSATCNHILRDKCSNNNDIVSQDIIPCDDKSTKKPSYVGLSCSVSGYSESNRYNSKLTEQENIPNRPHLLYSKSRDSSPQRTDLDYYSTHFIRPQINGRGDENHVNGHERGRTVFLQPKYGSNRSISVDRGQKIYKPERLKRPPSISNNITHSRTRDRYMNGYRENLPLPQNGASNWVDNIFDDHDNSAYEASLKSGSSFIRQRIEKLYGPGAVVQGYKISKRVINRERAQVNDFGGDSIDCALGSLDLPVFKHLSEEFKHQITTTEKPGNIRYIKVELDDDHPAAASPMPSEPSAGKVINELSTDNECNYMSAQETDKDVPSSCSVQVMSLAHTDDVQPRLSGGADSAHAESDSVVEDKSTISVNNEAKSSDEDKGGKHFLEVVNGEANRLQDLIHQCELDLDSHTVPEECVGVLLAANGKAGLLLKKKFQQFRGLCEKEMNPKEGDAVVTSEDLAGFWDLVCIQIADVDTLFERIAQMRASDWKEVSSPVHVNSGKKIVKKKTNLNRNTGRSVEEKAAASQERKQKLLEAKKRIRDQLKKQDSVPSDDVQIFT